MQLPPALLEKLPGPRHGIRGWRKRLGVGDRPLLCTALKPMGLPTSELSGLAHRAALGGIDIIKDDHGLADQPFAPFEERVARCAEAEVETVCMTDPLLRVDGVSFRYVIETVIPRWSYPGCAATLFPVAGALRALQEVRR